MELYISANDNQSFQANTKIFWDTDPTNKRVRVCAHIPSSIGMKTNINPPSRFYRGQANIGGLNTISIRWPHRPLVSAAAQLAILQLSKVRCASSEVATGSKISVRSNVKWVATPKMEQKWFSSTHGSVLFWDCHPIGVDHSVQSSHYLLETCNHGIADDLALQDYSSHRRTRQ